MIEEQASKTQIQYLILKTNISEWAKKIFFVRNDSYKCKLEIYIRKKMTHQYIFLIWKLSVNQTFKKFPIRNNNQSIVLKYHGKSLTSEKFVIFILIQVYIVTRCNQNVKVTQKWKNYTNTYMGFPQNFNWI